MEAIDTLNRWFNREAQAPVRTPIQDVTHAPAMGSSRKPRCMAFARSTGLPCQAPGNGRGGRCKLHGGSSSGARSDAGRKLSSDAMHARWADPAFRERQAVLRQERWNDPAFRLAIETGRLARQRQDDYARLRAQPRDIALGNWVAGRERARRARIEQLRLAVAVADLRQPPPTPTR